MASVTFVPSRLFGGDFIDVAVPTDADDGKALVWNKTLQMAVWGTTTTTPSYTPSLDFSDARNSMYAPLITGT